MATGPIKTPELPVTGISRTVTITNATANLRVTRYGSLVQIAGWIKPTAETSQCIYVSGLPEPRGGEIQCDVYDQNASKVVGLMIKDSGVIRNEYNLTGITGHYLNFGMVYIGASN